MDSAPESGPKQGDLRQPRGNGYQKNRRDFADPFFVNQWLIHPSLNRMSKGDLIVPLQPLVMQVLLLLSSRPGEVFSRDEILHQVWVDSVVGEEVLTRVISLLRRSLKDDSQTGDYVETIRKEGYRLIAEVREATGVSACSADIPAQGASSIRRADGSPAQAAAFPTDISSSEHQVSATSQIRGASSPQRNESRQLHTWLTRRILFFIICFILIGSSTALVLKINSGSEQNLTLLDGQPLTSFPGREIYPAISTDGSQTVFSWQGPNGNNLDLFVTQKNADTMLRLTDDPTDEYYACWSPDGTSIAFVRETSPEVVCLIPAIGGPTEELFSSENGFYALDWSPDGKHLAYVTKDSLNTAPSLFLYNLATGEKKLLIEPEPHIRGYFSPAFSCDGQRLAFYRLNNVGYFEIGWVSIDGGPVHTISTHRLLSGLDWMPGDTHLIYAAAPTADFSLWQVPLNGGSPRPLITRGGAIRPDVSPLSESLVYEELGFTCSIQRIATDSLLAANEPELVRHSTRYEFGPCYSPDGTRFAFVSMSSGKKTICVCDADGTDSFRVTQLESPDFIAIRWSPNGKQLTFSAITNGYYGVYLTDLDGGPLTHLYSDQQHLVNIDWSRDGQWLYYSCNIEAKWQTWKMRPDGTDREPVAPIEWQLLATAPTGEWLYFGRTDLRGIWRTDTSGENPTCLVASEITSTWLEIIPHKNGFYFLNLEDKKKTLCYYDLATETARTITSLPEGTNTGLSISPDGSSILFDVYDNLENDLILVENLP